MTIEASLFQRANSVCELCGIDHGLTAYLVPPKTEGNLEHSVLLCGMCKTQMQAEQEPVVHHWRCLNDSMWSAIPAVQVVAWRMLKRLSAELWARDLLDLMYMEDEVRLWAESAVEDTNDAPETTKDNYGNSLNNGDTVTLIKDLDVKGAGFTAKRGTAVRNIRLTDNPAQIEGRVNGTSIVLLTCFLKKA